MDYAKIVKEEISGSIARSYVAQIARFHRIQASTMFHEAAEYVKAELVRLGLGNVAIEQFTADGSKEYWTHTAPVGWTVNSAELRLTEPKDELICTYADCPQSLHTFSNATPTEGVTAELVDVGSGTKPVDYEGKDVKGKLVLATGRAKVVHEQAVYKRGALGVITDAITFEMPNVRESLDIPDAHAYQSIWPSSEDVPKVTFGFSLSKRQGNHLRDLLKEGKTVKLKATVDAKLFPSNLDIITATITGREKPDEEILLVAHLCHPKPSANDNASGSGLLLEIARTIKALIASGRIQQSLRTIRFLWVPETSGSITYLHGHEDLPTRLIAGMNLDMVGQNQELCKSTLNLDRTPDSLPSFLNDFVFGLIEKSVEEFDAPSMFGSSSTFRYRQGAFSGGSDHAEFTDSTIGVPCVMLLQWPDMFYHTSMDTIDKVSEESLKRVGWIATLAALELANAGKETCLELADQTASKGMQRIEEEEHRAVEESLKKTRDEKLRDKTNELAEELAKTALKHENRIEHITWREQQAVRSVGRLGKERELDEFIARFCEDITKSGKNATERFKEALNYVTKAAGITLPKEIQEKPGMIELKQLVPTRLFRGSLDFTIFKKRLSEEEFEWYLKLDERDAEFGKKSAEILNFMDGRRSGYDIAKAVSAEYSETDPDLILRYLRDLEKLKLISLK